MVTPRFRSTAALEAAAGHLRDSPPDHGRVEMIVARPADGERVELEIGELTLADGLVGDDWRTRGSSRTPGGSAHPDMQLALINRRFLALVAGDRDRWPLAGDQLVVDLDLGVANLPPGQRLAIGSAVVEVTPAPHNGCRKFTARFGADAVRFTASELGQQLRLRGVYVRVVRPGTVRRGEAVVKLDGPGASLGRQRGVFGHHP